MLENTCQICGCTENDCKQCIQKVGVPCHWIDDEKDLCSVCEELYVVKTLIKYFEYFDRGFGLCELIHIIRTDKKLVSKQKSFFVKEWLFHNLPEYQYFGRLKTKEPLLSWKLGNVDARWYWLQSKLKELKNENSY